MTQVIDLEKDKEVNLVKKEVEEVAQQSRSLDSKNKGLEQLLEILKAPNDICEC